MWDETKRKTFKEVFNTLGIGNKITDSLLLRKRKRKTLTKNLAFNFISDMEEI